MKVTDVEVNNAMDGEFDGVDRYDIVREVLELRAEIDRLRKALREYGRHGRNSDAVMCERDKHSEHPCTCGLDQALQGDKP